MAIYVWKADMVKLILNVCATIGITVNSGKGLIENVFFLQKDIVPITPLLMFVDDMAFNFIVDKTHFLV